MNIQMQFCGLLILILLLYFCLRQKALWMATEKRFLHTLFVAIFCECFDMLSIVAIVYREFLPGFVLALICKTYLVSLVALGYSCYVYTSVDLRDIKNARFLAVSSRLGMAVAMVLIYVLPIDYFHEGRKVYTLGPSVQATYIFALLFVISNIYRLIRYRKLVNQKRAHAIGMWMGMWMVATIIQAFNNAMLLVGFATALGMVVLFFELENPEGNMDRETGLLNSHALLELMKHKYADGQFFSLLLVSMEQYQRDTEEMGKIDSVMPELVSFFSAIPNARVFKRVEHDFVFLFSDEDALRKALDMVQSRFAGEWKDKTAAFLIEPIYTVLEDNSLAASAEEAFRILDVCKAHQVDQDDNQVVFINQEMIDEHRGKERIAKIIRNAMEEDRVEVFYQPIYGVQKKQFVSAEALVRIRNTDGSILPPGVFIPVAEENGSILRLGEIIFEKACQFIVNNNLREYGIHYIEVNLSIEQCEDEALAERYIRIMEQYQVDPSFINLEITETGSIKARNILLRNMQRLIEYGVCFSLDDFGNGESNLNYIVDMPVEIIKFDRDMTQAYFNKEKAKFVMSAARNMIQEMGLHIVSEGVETREQFEHLAKIGIDYIQGYYFSKPLPAEEFLAFVRAQGGYRK